MIGDNHDPLAAALAGLAVDSPGGLIDRVITRWAGVPGTRPPAGLLPALRTGRVSALRFDFSGLGAFDQAVLAAAATIPRGQVRPYRWIAEQVCRPGAVQAVSSALGRNPVPVLVGCHRVIRSDGAVGDYVFGAETKSRLLAVEGANLDARQGFASVAAAQLAGYRPCRYCQPIAALVNRRHRHDRRLDHRHGLWLGLAAAVRVAGPARLRGHPAGAVRRAVRRAGGAL
ncbi:MAG: methylated-DNA--[protein]-cysteine S-methyltransferase [Actinomycetota bacterium]|nr:methylated-DNA--[protein]-cysteine S-methyltransferase [Actinomycetota bacterium]